MIDLIHEYCIVSNCGDKVKLVQIWDGTQYNAHLSCTWWMRGEKLSTVFVMQLVQLITDVQVADNQL